MTNCTCKNIIEQRRSTRKFEQKTISRDDILEIIDAVRLAPSAKNRQPWSFYILEKQEK